MRLKKNEIVAITDVTHSVFGKDASVRIFGSRINDALKGGDIDLLIQCNHTLSSSEQYKLKINFLVQLKKIIGDQRIDVLIESNQQDSPLIQTIKQEGVNL